VPAIGDAIVFDDARGRSRRMIVRARDGAFHSLMSVVAILARIALDLLPSM
jgi:hypothetical protein